MAAASSSSSSPIPAVRIVDQYWVSSSRDGLPVTVGEVSIPLTFFDVFWGNHPMDRLFFYRWPDLATAHFVAFALPRLRRALSLTLRHYYPLAGSLRELPGSPDKLEIYCNDGDSVRFTLAECVDGDYFHLLAADQAHGVETLRPLVPEIPGAADGGGSLAVMALQVTVFPSAGVCVCVSIRHTACDGSGLTSFAKAWASACRSEQQDAASPAGELPLIDRTLVSDPKGLYTVFYGGRKSITGAVVLRMPSAEGPVIVRSTFTIKRVHIEELRRRVSEQSAPSPPLRYSSFVLTCAYAWVCLLKAREQPPPQGVGDAACLMFVADCRARLRPPLPAAYFGNCLGACFVDAQWSDLVREGGVGRAAKAIAESVARLGRDGEVLRDAEEWITKAVARIPVQPLTVAGSPRFGMYGVDFGWGRPAKVEVVGIEKTGAVSLTDSREEDGGVEIGLALPAAEMTKFSSLFAAGLRDTDD